MAIISLSAAGHGRQSGCQLLAADTLKPIRQGELDGLCGLYAAIHGVRLLLANERPLDRSEVRRLYNRGIAFLAGRNELTCTALAGFDHALWHKLLRSLLIEVRRVTDMTVLNSQPLVGDQLPSRVDTFALIEAVTARQNPVLIEVSGWYHHYTVVAGCTAQTIRLFDSGGLHRLTRSACGVDDEGSERHVISPQALTVLELA